MKDPQQVEQEFKAELHALLERYGAELELQDVGRGYDPDRVMVVTIMSAYDYARDEQIRAYQEFRLGSYFS